MTVVTVILEAFSKSDMRAFLVFFLACLAGGCAHYEFKITSPPDMRRHVGTKEEVILRLDPLEYRMISFEDHLVIRIYNRSSATIQFLGEQSTVVDPSGQSHPLRGLAIPTGSFMKLVLPPMPHYLGASGPYIGVGMGVGYVYGGEWRDGLGFDNPMWTEPRYVAVDEPGGVTWRWEGETDVRLLLSFQAGNEKPFTQEWVFHRKKSG